MERSPETGGSAERGTRTGIHIHFVGIFLEMFCREKENTVFYGFSLFP